MDNHLEGFEFLSCIPGTIGGGIRMNAGCFGKEFKDILLSIQAIDKSGKTIIEISKRLFRPQDVTYLLGDSRKAKKVLNWKPKKNIDYLIDDMIKFELMENNVNNKML